jgi:hypothetical protein
VRGALFYWSVSMNQIPKLTQVERLQAQRLRELLKAEKILKKIRAVEQQIEKMRKT